MDVRRKRLLFRARHMGTAENDRLFGGFAESHLDAMSAAQLDRFETLLEASDPDLAAWATGKRGVPAELDHDVMRLLQAYVRGGR